MQLGDAITVKTHEPGVFIMHIAALGALIWCPDGKLRVHPVEGLTRWTCADCGADRLFFSFRSHRPSRCVRCQPPTVREFDELTKDAIVRNERFARHLDDPEGKQVLRDDLDRAVLTGDPHALLKSSLGAMAAVWLLKRGEPLDPEAA